VARGGSHLGPQRPPGAQRPLRPPPDVDHSPAALPHLPGGPRRSRHGGAHAGPPAGLHSCRGLGFLDGPGCYFSAPPYTTTDHCTTTVVSPGSSSLRAERRRGGPWRSPTPRWWSRGWPERPHPGSGSRWVTGGGTMALLPAPMGRAHLYVALPRHWGRVAPTGGLPHRGSSCWGSSCWYSTWRLPCCSVDSTGGRRMGPDGPGSFVLHHGSDTSGWTRVDRRFRSHLPHHS
jgi:hypothetical protein